MRIRTRQLQAQKGELQSEYQQAYKAWPWQAPRKSIKPPSKNNKDSVHGVNISSTMRTTNQVVFVPHKPSTRTKSHAPKREYKRGKTKMVTDTTYDIDYKCKEASRRPPCKPKEQNHKPSVRKPFNTVSAYEATYTKWTPEEQKGCTAEIKIPKNNLNVLQVQFKGTTTVQDDFKPHENVQPAKSMRPTEKSHTSTKPFIQDQTTHQTDFAPKPPQQPREAFKPKEEQKAPSNSNGNGRYDYLTIMMRDFPEHVGHKPEESYKPKKGYRPTGTKLDDKTTQRMAFKAWPIPPRERQPWAERPAYKYQKGKLCLHTSYQDDFTDPCSIMPQAFEKCRAAPCRYENNLGAGESGPFDDRTEYKSKFVAWDGAKRAGSYKLVEEYSPPKTKFVGESIFHSHFKGEPAPPAKSCRPPQRPHSSSGKSMHFESTYRTNFRRPVSCPVGKVLSSEDVVGDEDKKAAVRPHSADK
ncbi:uncharacterized protein [Amphiura filiformis]|uniref:uncharacterized protein n=1 Tax=Amphiura filiformis TaxID=82378 RepID=UPI003B20D897